MKKNNKVALSVAAVLVLVFVVFSPALNNGFTNWDDNKYVSHNPLIKDVSPQGLKKIFTTFIIIHHHYHPLTLLSYAVEYHFFKLNPTVYILDNIILHLFNTLLIFWFVYLLTRRIESAIITSVLFGIHPMHVESVAWIAERKDVLYSFFYLIALICYASSWINRKIRARYVIFTFLLFFCSLLSKPAAVTLPLVLLVIDYYFAKKWRWNFLFAKWPFFILSIIFGYLASLQKPPSGIDIYSWQDRILFGSYAFGAYLLKLVAPIKLCAVYPYPQKVNEMFPAIFSISPVIFLIILFILARCIRYSKTIGFGILFYCSMLLPVSGFIPMSNELMADRYTYLPYIGAFFIVGQGYSYLMDQGVFLKKASATMLLGVLILFSTMTFTRCKVWKNGITLWTDVINKYPKMPQPYSNRGAAYAQKGDFALALADFNKTLEINPYETRAYNNRGYLYFQNGMLDQAIKDYSLCLSIYPKSIVSYLNRALAYIEKGEIDLAIHDYSKVLEINPNIPEASVKMKELMRDNF